MTALNRLTSLDLSYTPVTDAGLKELAGLKRLTFLDVFNTKVTPDGVARLKKAVPECIILSDPAPRPAGG